MTKEEFLSFWEGLQDANGSHGKRKNIRVTLCDKEKTDFIMHIATRLGFSCMYGTYLTKNNVKVYHISVREKITHALNFKDKRGAKIVVQEPNANEKVWCVSNKNKTISKATLLTIAG